jgi:hypothetical protein
MTKYLSLFFGVALILFVFFLQIGLINTLPYGFNRINLVLLFLVISLFFLDLNKALILAVILGGWLDIFSFNLFGVNMLVNFLVVLMADFMLVNWFSHRSAYSFLALTFFSSLFYNFSFYLFLFIFSFFQEKSFFLWSGNFWLGLSYELLWSLGLVFVFFVAINLTSNRLKPAFLDKK